MGMIGIGGGLMFKGLKGNRNDDDKPNQPSGSSGPDNAAVLEELADLRAKVARMKKE